MQPINNVNAFLKEKNLTIFQLFVLLAVKNKQPLKAYFPIHHLDAIYYVIPYTVKGEEVAKRVHKQIVLASHWLTEIHKQIASGTINYQALTDHEAKKQLDQELPTTFIKAAEQHMISEYIPQRQTFNQQYQYKVHHTIPFTREDISLYLQLKAGRVFLYEAILDSVLPEYVSVVSQPFYQLWQLNDFVGSCIDQLEKKNENKPNVITMVERLHNRQGSVEEVLRSALQTRKEQLAGFSYPTELAYLSATPGILEEVGKLVFKKLFASSVSEQSSQ